MKRVVGFSLVLLLLIGSISTAFGKGIDISTFEKDTDMYSIFREKEDVFIEVNLTSEEKDFSHKYNSEYYYNSIFPDIFIRNIGTEDEVAIPRLWLYYRTENNALNIKNIELSIHNTNYRFNIESSKITALEKGTISEELVIIIDKQSIDSFLTDWCYAASANKPIEVRLIGHTDIIKFEVPQAVANAGMELFWSYIVSLVNVTVPVLDYSGTPVTISPRYAPATDGMSMTYRDAQNGLTFTIPNGWAVVENEDEGGIVSAKIRWESEDRKKHANVKYSAYDVYSAMLSEGFGKEETDVDRTQINNSFVSKSDIADMLGISTNEIEYIKYGDYEYYTATVTRTETLEGFEMTITINSYINMNNGYMYFFSYTGDDSQFRDFEKMLISVKHDL